MKRQAKDRVEAASKGCDKVQAAWSDATKALGGSVSTNGYGIYHDRFVLMNKLLAAQESIKSALQELNEIDWPSDADYDQL